MKVIHVEVSEELHERIVQAAKANGNTFEEWVRMACLEAAEYDDRRDDKRRERRKAVKPMTEAQANVVYDILVADAGAIEDERDSFVRYVTGGGTEYRIRGHLGFGAKFWPKRMHMEVSYYPEDKTGKRDRIQATINRKLKAVTT